MNQFDTQALESDLAKAAKAQDKVKLTVLRLLKSALRNYEIEVGHDATPQEIMTVLQREAKKRQDSIESYTAASRQDLVEEEETELEIIKSYLPEPLSSDELEVIVDQSIAEMGATSLKDMGRVMADANKKAAGRASGSQLSEIVKSKLA